MFQRTEAAPGQEVMTFEENEVGPTHPPYKAVQTDWKIKWAVTTAALPPVLAKSENKHTTFILDGDEINLSLLKRWKNYGKQDEWICIWKY